MRVTVIPLRKELEHLLETFPPKPAREVLPKWYKEGKLGTLSGSVAGTDDPKTAKKCPAIQDIITTDLVIPLWGVLAFRTIKDDSGNIQEQKWSITSARASFEPLDMHLGSHPNTQTDMMDLGRTLVGDVLKIQCPYRFIVEDGYSVYYSDPFYHFRRDVQFLPGIVEVDKWTSVAFPFSIHQENFVIKPGTPIVHAHFFKRNETKIELDVRAGTEQEYEEYIKAMQKLTLTEANYKKLF
jgi:hypothetical protein